jgi:hypothetical protein
LFRPFLLNYFTSSHANPLPKPSHGTGATQFILSENRSSASLLFHAFDTIEGSGSFLTSNNPQPPQPYLQEQK